MADTPATGSAPDAAALRQWLASHLGSTVGDELVVQPISGGRSNPTYSVADGENSWVLRRPPFGHVLPTAHDMGREYRVLTALRDTAVPVPRTVGLCKDPSVIGAEFYVMEKLDGTTLRTPRETAQLSRDERAALSDSMVDLLVELHSIDPADVGLADWGRPDGYLERQLGRWKRQWEHSVTSPRPEVDELYSVLASTIPSSHLPGIVHGDFKIDNLMVDRKDPTRIIGLLDWEMSTVGDTLTDVGILCSFWDHAGEFHNPITAGATALEGFPRREALTRRYGALRGIDVHSLEWYLVFADFKIAVILEGIHARYLHGDTDAGDDFAGVGAMVGPLLDRALNRASESGMRTGSGSLSS